MTRPIAPSTRRGLLALGAAGLACAALPQAAAAAAPKKRAATRSRHMRAESELERERREALHQQREDSRLTRECRGRPNAGACSGYAR